MDLFISLIVSEKTIILHAGLWENCANFLRFSHFFLFCCLQKKTKPAKSFKIQNRNKIFKINSLVSVADVIAWILCYFIRCLVKLVLFILRRSKLLPVLLIADKTLETDALDLGSGTFSHCAREVSSYTYAKISSNFQSRDGKSFHWQCRTFANQFQAAISIVLIKLLKHKTYQKRN